MESPIWPESLPINRKKAIQELTQGQEWTDKLREILQQSENIESDSASLDGVVDRILGMFDNTLSIMGSRTSNEPLQFLTNYLQTSYSFDEQKSKTSDLQSLCSLELDERKLRKSDETFSLQTSYLESPRSSDENKSKKYDETSRMVIPVKMKRGCHKRKTSWASTQITSILTDDGHAWRKYGQKKILESKHESYYRCTYKHDQGCLATKQVQKMEDEPPVYKITYMRSHTCKNLQRAPQIILDSVDPRDTSILLNFKAKELTGNKQVNHFFQPMKHEPNEGSPSLGNQRDNQSTPSDDCLLWDLIMKVPQVPLESVSMSVGLDHEIYLWSEHGDMTSSYSSMASTERHEMDYMFESNDFKDFSF
ncbi:probable WRKY transcription factor 70 isoform X2 [Cynara cardunculus var. scolymus]|uniref:probable WRKY transcription factor 70 isoform X2 n=1 Tax=Cynara cardunculus var. scolymus TaxID=59895 RepID=UPI000D62BE5C|nr:probable WRKY transcription factor 70 isoform X2 [Cynara cardunculus var. scolymus]